MLRVRRCVSRRHGEVSRRRLALGYATLAVALLVCPARADDLGAAPGKFPRPEEPGTAGTDPEHAGRTVTMDFQDVEVGVLVKLISEVTGRSFIVDDRVSGTVTIIAPEKITPDEAYAVFQSVLQVKGFTTVQAGRAIKIVPAKDAKETTLRTGAGAEPGAPADEFVTRLARVHHVDAETVARVVEPLVSRDGLVRAYGPANMLVLVDTAANVERLLTVVQNLDVDREREQIDVIALRHAAATALAPTVTALVAQTAGGDAHDTHSAVVADERSNALIVRAPPTRMAQIRGLVERLDLPPTGEYARLNVYPLKHADAEALVEVLGGLLGVEAAVSGTARRAVIGSRGGTVRFPAPAAGPSLAPPARRAALEAADGGGAAPSAEFVGDVRVTADPATNSLLVSAGPQDYAALAAVIAQLDVPRPQVYVEAIILEVSVDRAEAMGFDFRGTQDLGAGVGLGAVNLRDAAGTFSDPARLLTDPSRLSGLILAAASNAMIRLPDGTEIPAQAALFNAIAQDDDINILSAPNILTTDNEEAEIVVGQNVPFITSRATSETNLDNLFATVERRDVGITLRITPQITEGDTVRLTIYEEVSALETLDADPAIAVTIGPVTRVRSASTSVMVGDGQTVAIGGLLAEVMQRVERKVPYLSSIPFLGNLMRRTDTKKMKTNLLIFLTPHILRTRQMLEAESADQRGRFLAELTPGHLTRLQYRRLAELGNPPEETGGDLPPPGTDWEVQAGATQDPARAEALVQDLAGKGYRAFILRPSEGGGDWYRVRIGGLGSRAEAYALARELVAQGVVGAFVPAP